MSDERYYVRSRGRVSGPYELEKLQELLRRGAISSAHELSTDQVAWRPVREHLARLNPAPAKPPPAPPAEPALSGSASASGAAVDDTAPVEFDCPQCGAHIAAPAQYAGRNGKCKSCGATVPIPKSAEGAAEMKKCPACAEMVRAEAKKCRHCGERLDGGAAEQEGLYALADDVDRRPTDLIPYRMSGRGALAPARGGMERVCPGCGAVAPSTSVICMNCGFNFQTGRHVSEHPQGPQGTPVHATQHNVHIHGDGVGIGDLMAFQASKKSVGVAYLFWFFLGGLGAHRFYAGRTQSAVTMLLLNLGGWVCICAGMGMAGTGDKDIAGLGGAVGSLPCFMWLAMGIWLLIDAFLIPGMIQQYNQALASGLTSSKRGLGWS